MKSFVERGWAKCCSRCNKYKLINKFSPDNRTKDKANKWCMCCIEKWGPKQFNRRMRAFKNHPPIDWDEWIRDLLQPRE